MSEIKDFNFYQFLKDTTNQSIAPLQSNDRYDDVLCSIADMFNTLYRRLQEIKVTNSLDLNRSNEFQKYLNDNDGTVKKDFILEMVSQYLDTDHFKDTVAILIRLYKERELDGSIPDLDQFIINNIIPPFKFFTMNAGDLHKSKGVQALLERLFEFYSPVGTNDVMFDGIIQQDSEDTRGKRFTKFTSYRTGLTKEILVSNYSSILALADINITRYVELENHKLCVADDYLFISKKEREDWWILDVVDDIYKINEYYFAVKQEDVLSFYKDDVDIYDSNYEYVTPTPFLTVEDVEFVPKIINIEDTFNEYHKNNLYFIEKIPNADTFSEFEYNLKRFKHDTDKDTTSIQLVKRGLGLSYEPMTYSDSPYPKITEYMSVDWMWLKFYEPGTTLYDFDISDVELVYSFVYEYQYSATENKLFSLGIARDGYEYNNEENGFVFNVIDDLTSSNRSKYVLQQRLLTSLVETELEKVISDDLIEISDVFDIFIPSSKVINEKNYYTFIDYWDASSGEVPTKATTKEDGDYWVVSVDGSTSVNGIRNWSEGDIIVWNDNFGYFEKNNIIQDLINGSVTEYKLDHTFIALGKDPFNYPSPSPDSAVTTPYEMFGGMFFLKFSDIPLNIKNMYSIIGVDTNPVETFGDDPVFTIVYKNISNNHYVIDSIKSYGFVREKDTIDLTRLLQHFPTTISKLTFQNFEFSDKHMIVYVKDSNNTTAGSTAIILENAAYNFPLGLRTNEINMSYDVDLRTLTRNNQEFYRINDDDDNEIEDKEVATFKETLNRYSPINTNHDSIYALADVGFVQQTIETEHQPDRFPVTVRGSSKQLNEQSNIKMIDSLTLVIDGDSSDVNCDCNYQQEQLYVVNFQPMTLFYDLENLKMDENIIGVPSKIVVNKVGKVSDVYSNNEDVCRFESDWFEYAYDLNATIPLRIRTKIRVNLYDKYQSFVPWGSDSVLEFNWGMHFLVQYVNEDSTDTIPNWQTSIDEEIFKPITSGSECNSVGNFYTTKYDDNGNTFPESLKDPWVIYNIVGAELQLS